MNSNAVGLGNSEGEIQVYIENVPPLEFYQQLDYCYAMQSGDIAEIAKLTGNHWRKIFNVYAKLVFEMTPGNFPSWQQLRDEQLLQQNSQQALLFSAPPATQNNSQITIIMGKTYATKLGLAQQSQWLSEVFAINQNRNMIICPYFDYRQLSNQRISQLTGLIKGLRTN